MDVNDRLSQICEIVRSIHSGFSQLRSVTARNLYVIVLRELYLDVRAVPTSNEIIGRLAMLAARLELLDQVFSQIYNHYSDKNWLDIIQEFWGSVDRDRLPRKAYELYDKVMALSFEDVCGRRGNFCADSEEGRLMNILLEEDSELYVELQERWDPVRKAHFTGIDFLVQDKFRAAITDANLPEEITADICGQFDAVDSFNPRWVNTQTACRNWNTAVGDVLERLGYKNCQLYIGTSDKHLLFDGVVKHLVSSRCEPTVIQDFFEFLLDKERQALVTLMAGKYNRVPILGCGDVYMFAADSGAASAFRFLEEELGVDLSVPTERVVIRGGMRGETCCWHALSSTKDFAVFACFHQGDPASNCLMVVDSPDGDKWAWLRKNYRSAELWGDDNLQDADESVERDFFVRLGADINRDAYLADKAIIAAFLAAHDQST